MAVIQNIQSLKFFNQARNGDDFSANTSEYSPHFTGNIGELVKVNMLIDLSWYASALEMGYFDIFAGYIISVGSFLDEGFEVGQTFEFYSDWNLAPSSAEEFVGQITSISQNGRRIDFTVTSGTQITTGTKNFNAAIWAQADLIANAPNTAIISFLLAPNNTNPNYNNPNWIGTAIDLAGGAAQNMSWAGQYKDKKSGSCTIKRNAFGTTKNGVTYEVDHIFRVSPFYEIDYLSYINANTTPPDWQANLNYFFKIEFKHGLNSTRAKKVISPTNSDGLSSWYNNSIGGYFNRYVASNVQYEDTTSADTVTGLQTKSRTTIQFDVDKAAITGSAAGFSTGDAIRLYIAYLPDTETQYVDTLTDLESNFILGSLSHTSGTSASVGAGIIKSLECTVSGGKMSVEAEIEYNSAQQVQIGKEGKYIVFAQLADTSLSIVNSDRTVILVHNNEYYIPNYVTNLASFTKFNILTHNEVQGTDTGFTPSQSGNFWNEDGVLLDYILQLDTDKQALLTNLTFALVARKIADNTYFFLDSYEVDLSGIVVQTGIQQININQTRNYLLKSGDQFNKIKLENGASGSGTQDYNGQFGQKIKWQDWVFNPDVDPVFLDFTKPNNNQNYKSNTYSNASGYEICILGIADTEGLDSNGLQVLGRNLVFSGNMDIYDYGISDDGLWDGTIYTLDPDTLQDLGGKILGHKNTLFRTIWENSDDDIPSLYCIHRIQKSGSSGDDIEELSTLRDNPANQILIPKSGQTHLHLFASGGDIYSECLIDYTKLGPGPYNLSARIERYTVSGNFAVSFASCDMTLTNVTSFTGITNIEYEFKLGTTVIETVNTTDNSYTWPPSALYDGETLEIKQTITHDSGTDVDTQNIEVAVGSSCYVEIDSNTSGAQTFSPEVSSFGNSPFWRWPDETYLQSVTPSVLGADVGFDGTTKTVRFAPEGPFSEITDIKLITDNIVGNLDLSNFETIGSDFRLNGNASLTGVIFSAETTVFSIFYIHDTGVTSLDLSLFTNLAGDVRLFNNASLTSVTLPISSQSITFLWIYSCNITGTLNISTLTGLSGSLRLNNNPLMTAVILPSTSAIFNTFHIFGTGISGNLNISLLTGLGGSIQLNSNSLTSITFPSSSQTISSLYVYSNNITGTLDISGLSGFGNNFRAYSNPNLTSLTLPSTSNVFQFFWVYSCNLTGTVVLSSLTGLGGSIRLESNPNLTAITLPSSSQAVTFFYAHSCGLTGTLNLSPMTGLGGDIQVHNNTSLSGITLPTSSVTTTRFRAYSCNLGYVNFTTLTFSSAVDIDIKDNGMTAAEVNQILFDLDSTLPGTGTGTIDISGSNAAPDGSSGGYDGITAKNNLISKGYTVTTS